LLRGVGFEGETFNEHKVKVCYQMDKESGPAN
jgi:hypothetical protein